jgi:hypothetical protein
MTTAPLESAQPRGPAERLALFADCLVVGLLTSVTAIGVVTAYPGFTAACAVLRDRVRYDGPAGPRAYGMWLRQVARTGPRAFLAVPPLVAAVLGADAVAVAAGIPGRSGLLVALSACVAVATVLGLRLAAAWRPEPRWPEAARAAVRASVADPGGSALLLIAAGVATLLGSMVPIIAPLLPGPLALAAVAVDIRSGRGGGGV